MSDSVIYPSRVRHNYVRDLTPGGWSAPLDPQGNGACHYWVLAPDGLTQPRALCGAQATNREPLAAEQVTDTDPLAAENCILCRTLLLIRRGLI